MSIWSSLRRDLGFIFRFVLRFLFRSFSGPMGCLFACFRTRDDRRLPTTHLASDSTLSKPRGAVSRNQLSSLFMSEEKEDSLYKDKGKLGLGSQIDDKELKDEAKFLKGCGTLAGTPAEIRKASEKLKVSPSCGKDSKPSKFHSWLPNTPIEKLQLESQHFGPTTPKKLCEEWGNGSDSLDHTPSSCISNAQNSTQFASVDSTGGSMTASLHTDQSEKNATSASSWLSATDIQRRNKSVRFERDTDLSSCGSSSEYGRVHMKKIESPTNHQCEYKPLPYPTPLKLSDEMQTPGTVYPSTLEDSTSGKLRVRSQYVYSVYNISENVSQFKLPEESDFNSNKDSGDQRDSLDQPHNATPAPNYGLKRIQENESKVEASLSAWLKPASVIQEERKRRMEATFNGIPSVRKSPVDRPIIGMVAAHWNEEDDARIPPPKWWDGNGIPNSTNKYKEDQKVSWHATPFEERLEKALSEETIVSQRKPACGQPISFDDTEESDTALSRLQPSAHQQSVVSC